MTKQLHDGDTTGVVVGRDSNDKVAFFGSTPVTQQVVTGTLNETGTSLTEVVQVTARIRAALASLGLLTSS